jgi:diketogulonate reductase-like aldo/keto reductase
VKTIHLSDGTPVPVLGQGTWKIGEGTRDRTEEVAALRLGIDSGMTLIDTAEMYGEGASEEVVAEAIEGQRERVFVVTKVYPHNATRRGMHAACERSLRRLRIEAIDLYLLHWRSGPAPLTETVEAFEQLQQAGKIRRWGVSNFDVNDLEELDGADCAVNQVLYNPEHRGIEHDLLPWCLEHRLPLMAYSPLGQGGRLLQHRTLLEIGRQYEVSAAQVALAWALRHPDLIAIPKATDVGHVRANAAASDLLLAATDLAAIDRVFPPPSGGAGLEML